MVVNLAFGNCSQLPAYFVGIKASRIEIGRNRRLVVKLEICAGCPNFLAACFFFYYAGVK